MYRREEFREWFSATGRKPNTVAVHISILNGIDRAFDLDVKLKELGTDQFIAWTKSETSGPFEKYPSNTRSALNRYVEFHIAAQAPAEEISEADDEAATSPLVFQLEHEMQTAVRRQLEELESGLTEADDGQETTVATGRVDIIARDKAGGLVVTELKDGQCPSSGLEQVLGYADALSEEREEQVRAYLISGSFSDRTRAAARRTADLKLRTYEFSVNFNKVDGQRG